MGLQEVSHQSNARTCPCAAGQAPRIMTYAQSLRPHVYTAGVGEQGQKRSDRETPGGKQVAGRPSDETEGWEQGCAKRLTSLVC